MTSIAHSKNIEHRSEELAEMWNEEDNMNAKINMEAVIAEFKERLAYEKKCFQSMSKREQRELRSQRKAVNLYVEQVIADWRAMWNEEGNMNAKIKMDAVIAEFKQLLAYEKMLPIDL